MFNCYSIRAFQNVSMTIIFIGWKVLVYWKVIFKQIVKLLEMEEKKSKSAIFLMKIRNRLLHLKKKVI